MPSSGLFQRALSPGTNSLTKPGLSQIHLPPRQVAPSPIHRGFEHFQGWLWAEGLNPGLLLSNLWPPLFSHTGPLNIFLNQISTRLQCGAANWVRKSVFARVDGFIYSNNKRWGLFFFAEPHFIFIFHLMHKIRVHYSLHTMAHRQGTTESIFPIFLWEIRGAGNSCSHWSAKGPCVCECLHVEYGWDFRLPPGDEHWQNCGLRWAGLSLQHWFFFFFNHQLSMMKYWGGIILIQLFFPTAIHYYL